MLNVSCHVTRRCICLCVRWRSQRTIRSGWRARRGEVPCLLMLGWSSRRRQHTQGDRVRFSHASCGCVLYTFSMPSSNFPQDKLMLRAWVSASGPSPTASPAAHPGPYIKTLTCTCSPMQVPSETNSAARPFLGVQKRDSKMRIDRVNRALIAVAGSLAQCRGRLARTSSPQLFALRRSSVQAPE